MTKVLNILDGNHLDESVKYGKEELHVRILNLHGKHPPSLVSVVINDYNIT